MPTQISIVMFTFSKFVKRSLQPEIYVTFIL